MDINVNKDKCVLDMPGGQTGLHIVYQGFRLDLCKRSEMIWSFLTTFEGSNIFFSHYIHIIQMISITIDKNVKM